MARGSPRSEGFLSSSVRYSSAEAGASLAPGWLANRRVGNAIGLFRGRGKKKLLGLVSTLVVNTSDYELMKDKMGQTGGP